MISTSDTSIGRRSFCLTGLTPYCRRSDVNVSSWYCWSCVPSRLVNGQPVTPPGALPVRRASTDAGATHQGAGARQEDGHPPHGGAAPPARRREARHAEKGPSGEEDSRAHVQGEPEDRSASHQRDGRRV